MTHLSSLAIFLLALGSALRLTRLAVADTITAPFRAWLGQRYAATLSERVATHRTMEATVTLHGSAADLASRPTLECQLRKLNRRAGRQLWFVQLFECPWCIGFWISLAVAAVALSPVATTLWFAVPALGLSLSYLVGTIYTVVYTVEEFEPNGGHH